jgi:hypothetical protein
MASGVVKKDKEVQIAIILNCASLQIINICDQFIWDEEGGEKKPEKLFEKLEGYLFSLNSFIGLFDCSYVRHI